MSNRHSLPESPLWSRIDVAAEESPHWTESRGTPLVDLYDVSLRRGRIVLHGVNELQARRVLSGYRHFVRNAVHQDRFDDVFECSSEPFRPSDCERIEDDAAFLLSPWHPDNAYHLHNDNLLAMFANLRHAGALSSARRLLMYDGDHARNANAVQLWELMAAMFDGRVTPFSQLASSRGVVGLRRLRWGAGPQLFYLRDPDTTPFAGAAPEFQRWVLAHYGLPARERSSTDPLRVLMLQRTDRRRVIDDALLANALRAAGVEVQIFGDWANVSARELVAMVQASDILLGVHGAALAHMVYLPAKSMVAELRINDRHPHVFAHMARQCEHRHEPLDVRGTMTADGMVITTEEAASLASRIRTAWHDRHRRRALTVRTLGTGNWGNEVFWYMFGKTYAFRHGLEFQSAPWAGNTLLAAVDPPIAAVLPDVHEKTLHGVDDVVLLKGPPLADVNATGYFQYHTSYYAPDRDRIRAWFKTAPEVESAVGPHWERLRSRGGTIVGIHVRRRDYGFSYFYRTPIRWYLKELERLWPTLDRPLLFIATDAPEEVVPHFARFAPTTAADLGAPLAAHDFYRDFYALQHCDVLLIPNSTFSFSAAMLNKQLQAAYRSHLPVRGFVRFDPWNSKPLDQTWDSRVEKYPWIPELWRPSSAWFRWSTAAMSHVRYRLGRMIRLAQKTMRWVSQRVRV